MGIIKPGSRCLVIGEDRSYEENIGATVTVTHLSEGLTMRGVAHMWRFKDASRPILVARFVNRRGEVVQKKYVVSSEPWDGPDGSTWVAAFPPKYLMPLEGDEVPAELLEVATHGH